MLTYEFRFNEILYDFLRQAEERHPRLRARWTTTSSATGAGDLVKLDILVNGVPVDALSLICHRTKAEARGRRFRSSSAARSPAPPVRDGPPGRDRQQDHRPRDDQALPQGRDGQMLRRRRDPQAEAAGEAEGGEEEDARPRHGHGRYPGGRVH